jgi:hypothetical protein
VSLKCEYVFFCASASIDVGKMPSSEVLDPALQFSQRLAAEELVIPGDVSCMSLGTEVTTTLPSKVSVPGSRRSGVAAEVEDVVDAVCEAEGADAGSMPSTMVLVSAISGTISL